MTMTDTPSTLLDGATITFLKAFLEERSGYILFEDKHYLLESRVKRLLADNGLPDARPFIAELAANPTGALAQAFIESMTINETLFFRDARLFDNLTGIILPSMLAEGKRSVRIWSAACSSGQEPYSIAMAIEENRDRLAGLEYAVLGTDINRQVLERAATGSYSDFEIKRGLPVGYKDRYFTQEAVRWHIAPRIKERVTFRGKNLKDPFTDLGSFDVIFLRNVLIYFDTPLKESILAKCWGILSDKGALALGGSESIAQLTHPFPRFADESGYYRKDMPGKGLSGG